MCVGSLQVCFAASAFAPREKSGGDGKVFVMHELACLETGVLHSFDACTKDFIYRFVSQRWRPLYSCC